MRVCCNLVNSVYLALALPSEHFVPILRVCQVFIAFMAL